MKVFIDKKEAGSIAIRRTLEALEKYAPKEIKFVDNPQSSDLVIINVTGRLNHLKDVINYFNKPYVIVQHAFKSTKNPEVSDWLPVWKPAKLVWSHYDLSSSQDFNFYRSPPGVDKVFKVYPTDKMYIIASSGLGYLSESVRECILAAEAVNAKVFHIGPHVTNRSNVDFSDGIDDMELSKKYSACKYVSGLRRGEGFELPVIEGLVCGARPIVFDQPHYRDWFSNFAIFIPETNRDNIIASLMKIFKGPYKPVTASEISKVRNSFDWSKIIKGFWQRII
jgi:hypothetical protein